MMVGVQAESFYDSNPQLLFNEIGGFETSPRSHLLECGAPCVRVLVGY